MKDVKNIYVAVALTISGIIIFIFYDSIPTIGGISIALALIAGAVGGSVTALLSYFGMLKQNKAEVKTQSTQQGEIIMESRNIFIRLLAAFGWLILIYIITNFIIGATVGGIAGASTDTYEAGAVAGEKASIEFFQNYGLFILLGQLSIFSLLAFFGKLPGTAKLKSVKNT